jgi:acyl-CoA thioesterase
MQVTRMTVDLLHPVRVMPTTIEARLARPGRRVQLVEANAVQDGEVVARARALRVRVKDVALPASVPSGERPPFARPERCRGPGVSESAAAFHSEGAELRFAEGEFGTPGPAKVWVRLRYPVLPDEEPSPLQRAVAAADFSNGVSSPLPFTGWLFVNADLTVYLVRLPEGEWVCLDAGTDARTNGIGLSSSRLWDASGPIGWSLQSLLVEPVPQA